MRPAPVLPPTPRTTRRRGLVLAAVLALPLAPSAQACAVCFGQTDSPLGKGLHWGVLALLACIFAMLVAFGAFAIFLARRSVLCEAERAAEEGRDAT